MTMLPLAKLHEVCSCLEPILLIQQKLISTAFMGSEGPLWMGISVH
jgi:hypothetical protein